MGKTKTKRQTSNFFQDNVSSEMDFSCAEQAEEFSPHSKVHVISKNYSFLELTNSKCRGKLRKEKNEIKMEKKESVEASFEEPQVKL